MLRLPAKKRLVQLRRQEDGQLSHHRELRLVIVDVIEADRAIGALALVRKRNQIVRSHAVEVLFLSHQQVILETIMILYMAGKGLYETKRALLEKLDDMPFKLPRFFATSEHIASYRARRPA